MKLKSVADDLFATNVFDTHVTDSNCALPPVAPTQCAVSSTGMLPLERAARLCRRNRRVLYRWVEARGRAQ